MRCGEKMKISKLLFVIFAALPAIAEQNAGITAGWISAGDGSGHGGFVNAATFANVHGRLEAELFKKDSTWVDSSKGDSGTTMTVPLPGTVFFDLNPSADFQFPLTKVLIGGVTRPDVIHVPASISLRSRKGFTARVEGFAEFLQKAKDVSLGNDTADNSSYFFGERLLPHRIVGVNLAGIMQKNRVDISIFSQLTRLRFDCLSRNPDDPAPVTNLHDDDLWFFGDGAFRIIGHKLFVAAGGVVKDDFNQWTGYNLANVHGGIGTDMQVARGNVMLSGNLGGRYIMSSEMDQKGFQTGAVSTLNFRGILVPLPMFYIKGDAMIEAGSISTKQAYLVSVKKVKKKFAIEGGYYVTSGTLFPRMDAFARSSIGIGKHLSVEPSVRNYWDYQMTSGKYEYSRFDGALDLKLMPHAGAAVFNNMTIAGGAAYRWYPAPPSSQSVVDWKAPSLEFSIGVETWI